MATRATATKLKRKTTKRATGAERRKWDRLPVAIPVFIRGIDEKGKDFLEFATALNISAGGALVVTRRYLPPTATISIEIPCAPVHISMTEQTKRKLKAKLVRVSTAERCHLVGLRFARPLRVD